MCCDLLFGDESIALFCAIPELVVNFHRLFCAHKSNENRLLEAFEALRSEESIKCHERNEVKETLSGVWGEIEMTSAGISMFVGGSGVDEEDCC